MTKEAATFDPRCEVPVYHNYKTGKDVRKAPMAHLTFPDMATAADFINRGADPRYAASLVSAETLEKMKESPVGPHGEYDAFVNTDYDTGDVIVSIRHYGRFEREDHTALSEFIVRTVEDMAESEPIQ